MGGIWGAVAVALALVLGAGAAMGQRAISPAFVVNERAVTDYEIEQRILLLRAFNAAGDLRALAIEQLTSDRLRLQAADALGLELDEAQRTAALEEFAGTRNLTPDQVRQALRARGIAFESLEAFLEAGLLWREVVQTRFRARATPSDSDLDAALGLAQRANTEAILLQEIAIPFAERGEEETLALAKDLSLSLNRGGNFPAAVRRYSRGPSAARGGRLNWTPARALPPPVAAQILALLPGEVSAPVPVPQGVLIFKVLDRRDDPGSAALASVAADDTLVYSQLIVELSGTAPGEAVRAAEAQLNAIRAEAELCSDLDAQSAEFAIGSGRSAPTPAADVPPALSRVLAALDVGQLTVERTSQGVALIMLCSRGGQTSGEERAALRNRIFNQRMNALAQGFLQELRADAVIEAR